MNGKKERDNLYDRQIQNLISKHGDSKILSNYCKDLSLNKEKNTVWNYLNYIVEFLEYVAYEKEVEHITYKILNDVLPLEISSFIDERYVHAYKEYSTEHGAICWTALNSFYKFLCNNFKSEMTNGNPVERTVRPKLRSRTRDAYLTPSEIQEFMAHVKTGERYKGGRLNLYADILGYRDYVMCQIFLQLGLRASSVVAINISDVDFKNHLLITHEKGGNEYTYELDDALINSISKWLELRRSFIEYNPHMDALFVSHRQRRVCYRATYEMIVWYGNKIGREDITPHALRHSFGTNLYNITQDIELVQEEMRHKKITTTQRYITVSTEKKKEARAKMSALVNG